MEPSRSDGRGQEQVCLAGEPYELGRSHGEQLRGGITSFLEDFLRQGEQVLGTPFALIRDSAKRLQATIPAEYLQEMQGIADGAGLELEDVLALNSFVDTDLIHTSQRMTCISVVAYGEATADGSLIHGRNTDYSDHGIFQRTATVFACRPAKGHPYLSVAWSGFSGVLTAMNGAGLTVTEVGFVSHEVQPVATPAFFILRQIAQYASSLDEAVEIVASAKRTAGFNLTVTDYRIPEARAIEFTATRCGVRAGAHGRLIVADNRLSKGMRKGQLAEPCAVARYLRALELVEAEHGRIDVGLMQRLLADRFDLFLRAPGSSYSCICSRHTVQSVVFEPQQRRVWVSNRHRPAPDGQYLPYTLPG